MQLENPCRSVIYISGLCFPSRDGQAYSEEVRNVAKGALTACLVGLVYGGLPGARHARERFIQLNQAEIYRSRVEAVVREQCKGRASNMSHRFACYFDL